MDWQRLKPSYWFQNEPTNPAWDRVLNALLDEHEVEIIDGYDVKIGPARVWVANWPYAYGRSSSGFAPFHGLPRVATRKRLRAAIEAVALARVVASLAQRSSGE